MNEYIEIYKKNEFVFFTADKITTYLNKNGEEKKNSISRRWKHLNKDNFLNYVKQNEKTLIIVCGKLSNISVIDFDDVLEFNKIKLLHPELKKYYTVKTNKGYHLYFKYNEKIKTGSNCFTSYKNVDIRNDGGIIFAPPTKYNLLDGTVAEYKYLGGEIFEMPEYLINLISAENIVNKNIKYNDIKNELTKKDRKEYNDNIKTSLNILCEDDEEIKSIIEHLKLLNFDDYNKWYKYGHLIYSLNLKNGFEIWNELSRSSDNYDIEELKKKWEGFNKRVYTLGSLYYFCKVENPEEFNKLKRKYINPIEAPLIDTIKIYKKFLVDKDDKEILNYTDNFYSSEEIKSMNIKSRMGSGKTTLLLNIIDTYEPKRILYLSFRKTLTNEIYSKFQKKNFKNYMNKQYDADRLILQLESIPKLFEDANLFIDEGIETPYFDLIILDELESILSHFSSSTFKNMSKVIFSYFEAILKTAKKIISLDGDLGNRSFHFLKTLGKHITIENEYNDNNKELKFVENESVFNNDIYNKLDKNKNIVLCSMSATIGETYYKNLSSKYPNKKISFYCGKTDDKIKIKHFSNVSKYWSEQDILIYSPTCEAGIDFNLDHFNKMYFIPSLQSTSQRAGYQMMGRIRKLEDPEILILNNDNTLGKLKEEDPIYWNFEEVKNNTLECRKNITTPEFITNKDGKLILKKAELSTYDINDIYNQVEELNKNKTYFINKFIEIGRSKQFKITYIKKEKDEANEEKMEKMDKAFLINADEIESEEYNKLILKQQTDSATEDDKIKIKKYLLLKKLGIHKLDDDIIKLFDNDTIYNFINLIDSENIKNNNDNKTERIKEKTKILNELINNLGFKNCLDTSKILYNDFNENLINIVNQDKIFNKYIWGLFNFSKKIIDKTSNRALIGYINSLLIGSSLKISCCYIEGKKKIKENSYYTLNILNNINELIGYKIKYYKFKLYDKENIFIETDEEQYIYNHLIDADKVLLKELLENRSDDIEQLKIYVNNLSSRQIIKDIMIFDKHNNYNHQLINNENYLYSKTEEELKKLLIDWMTDKRKYK